LILNLFAEFAVALLFVSVDYVHNLLLKKRKPTA
jgi:hypothetical protein